MNELEIINSRKIVATKQNPNKKWVSVESLKNWLENYIKYLENSDEILCGCGCNTYISLSHGQFQRYKIDLLKAIEELQKSNKKGKEDE